MNYFIAFFSLLFVGITNGQTLKSPDNQLELIFELNQLGKPTYQLKYKNKSVIQPSNLGLVLKNNDNLVDGFEVINAKATSFSDKWKPVLGEEKEILDQHNQLIVELLQKATGRKMNLVFRLFNEGLAFRYEIPTQEKLNYFVIADEETQFSLTGDHKAFWIPGDYDSQEYSYNETKLSQIDVDKLDMNNGIGMKGPMAKSRIQSPVMMKSADGLYLNIFEAAVVNYPIMHLDVYTKSFQMQSHLVPNAIGDKAYLQAPANTPWRTIMVSDDARIILASKMVLNLNEPSKIEDTSWIKPMKYVGIWWEMHVGKATWDYAGSQNAQMAQEAELKPTGKHGATTENTKKYIDFAKQNTDLMAF
ncbi:glycoside hydrolase family 97 N-terminal domain-containing protein [Flavobacterium piscinae]|uniref:glycoside hydrolase family 97 N-terminal domain-containing protein n=1 Tax=Flavobacterium piscinae TaxID=2506424 RepID=UPI0037095743